MSDAIEKLRLLVRDADDLSIASTLLQDAIIPGADIKFVRRDNEFIIIANRFCWEESPLDGLSSSDGKPVHERRLCALRVAHVVTVQQQNWPQKGADTLFNLLALRHTDMAEEAGVGALLQFDFSGGASLRLKIDRLDMLLADLDVGHFTSLQPAHDL
jgi:hypothetical protein